MAFTNAKDDCLVKLCNNKNPEAETSKTAVERSVWEEKAKKWRRTSATGFCKEETSFGGARFFVANEVATAIVYKISKRKKKKKANWLDPIDGSLWAFGNTNADETVVVLSSLSSLGPDVCCSCNAYSRSHITSLMAGLLDPSSCRHFSAVSLNFLNELGLIIPFIEGSTISSIIPFFLHLIAQSAKFICSLGSCVSMAGLALRTSRRTTPNE
ncbi:hypothetical protein G4B88_006849 [Cannabis sativa]|uniref:SWIM-type domain-containing protein n=1 Tax=Cannabis sativa TaxID=3483 RepID=A0A7J6G668_CANSA|nr:hypothetical protein G4B88_006849 [Cannabis sativa]